MSMPFCNKGDKLVCSVCGKNITASDDTKYITNGGYTCDWNCFLTPIKEREKKKKQEEKALAKLKKKDDEILKEEITANTAETVDITIKKRGRPKKLQEEVIVIPEKKKRGRPKKQI